VTVWTPPVFSAGPTGRSDERSHAPVELRKQEKRRKPCLTLSPAVAQTVLPYTTRRLNGLSLHRRFAGHYGKTPAMALPYLQPAFHRGGPCGSTQGAPYRRAILKSEGPCTH
jgi:hypothetical protein